MTKLFRELESMHQSFNSHPQPSQSGTAEFIDNASKQGFKMTPQDFMRFAKMAEGKDMGAVVQELRSSGAITDAQFSELQNRASGFMSLLKMFTGK